MRRLLATVCAALLVLTGLASASGGTPAWTTYGAAVTRAGEASGAATTPTRDFVLSLPGRVTAQVLAADGLFVAVTSSGRVAGFDRDGSPVWSAQLGQFSHSCAMLDGYGNTGTPVIDPATSTLYVADGFGRLHALALATGAERPGWPVRVYDDPEHELDWGALTLIGAAVFVPTASYCDESMLGGVFRVDVRTRRVSHWVSVPASLGGGGGVWGWGGLAVSGGALYAATANALEGGSNTGGSFTEAAGYGEHIVRLSAGLQVVDSDHPADLPGSGDLDFVGSPVVIDPPGCGALVVAAAKDDHVWAWRVGDLAAGPVWRITLEQYDVGDPFLSQLAWSASTSSLYAVTGTSFDRIAVGRDCKASLAWRRPLGTKTENGSPTVAAGSVYFAVNAKNVLAGYDARTGARRFSAPLGGTTFAAPAIVAGRLVVGTFTGLVEGFSVGPVQAVRDRVIARGGTWTSRVTGVYAGARRIYPSPAQVLVQVSASVGAIEVGVAPAACMCHVRALWTGDGGRTWRATAALAGPLVPAAGAVWWWNAGTLYRTTFGREAAAHRVLADATASIVGVAPVPGGVAALLSSRVHGANWDTSPRVAVVRGARVRTFRLPAKSGEILVRSISAAGSTLTVKGTDFGTDPVRTVTWRASAG